MFCTHDAQVLWFPRSPILENPLPLCIQFIVSVRVSSLHALLGCGLWRPSNDISSALEVFHPLPLAKSSSSKFLHRFNILFWHRRIGQSRGFAFVWYKYADKAKKVVELLDGKNVDGWYIMVQFTKYNPNAEIIHRGTITTSSLKPKADRSRSRSRPLPHRNSYDNQDWEHSGWDSVCDRYEHDEYRDNDRYYHHQSLSQSPSPRREMRYIISPS